MSTEKDIAERLRAAFVQHHGNKVGDPFVSQIAREIASIAAPRPGREVVAQAVEELGASLTGPGHSAEPEPASGLRPSGGCPSRAANGLPFLNGDHAEFEREWAGVEPKDRPDWPFPSFDARDWAEAFSKEFSAVPEDVALSWFASALMRGWDEHAGRVASAIEARRAREAGTPILSLVGEVVEAARELSSALDAADDEVSKFEAERRAWSSAPAVRALHARTSLRAALAKLTGSAPPAPASDVAALKETDHDR